MLDGQSPAPVSGGHAAVPATTMASPLLFKSNGQQSVDLESGGLAMKETAPRACRRKTTPTTCCINPATGQNEVRLVSIASLFPLTVSLRLFFFC